MIREKVERRSRVLIKSFVTLQYFYFNGRNLRKFTDRKFFKTNSAKKVLETSNK